MWKLILQEDKCTSDSLAFFSKKVKEILGVGFVVWESQANKTINNESIILEKDNYRAECSADDPYWKLYELEEQIDFNIEESHHKFQEEEKENLGGLSEMGWVAFDSYEDKPLEFTLTRILTGYPNMPNQKRRYNRRKK